MQLSNVITAIDSHTEGEPMRIITSGLPPIAGSTMAAKYGEFEAKLRPYLTTLLYEPRGHGGMCGAVLTEPTTEGADVGVIWLEPIGPVSMCGHGTIAIATALVETGRVSRQEPTTEIVLDTLAGPVRAHVQVEHGRAREVTIRNVESFSFRRGVSVELAGLGPVSVDIAYGGMFYAIVEASSVGLALDRSEAARIVEIGQAVVAAVKQRVALFHPTRPGVEQVIYAQFSGPPTSPGASMKNAVVVSPLGIDRSPCGTGTSARMADLHAKGRLGLGEAFVHESLIGTLFRGRLIAETRVGEFAAVIPEITGRAFITGFQQFVIDPDDPLRDGFLL